MVIESSLLLIKNDSNLRVDLRLKRRLLSFRIHFLSFLPFLIVKQKCLLKKQCGIPGRR